MAWTSADTHKLIHVHTASQRGGRPGLPVPNGPYGLCGRKATVNVWQQATSEGLGGLDVCTVHTANRNGTVGFMSSAESRCVQTAGDSEAGPHLTRMLKHGCARAHIKLYLMWWDRGLSVVRWYIVHVHTADYIGCGGTVDSMLSAGT